MQLGNLEDAKKVGSTENSLWHAQKKCRWRFGQNFVGGDLDQWIVILLLFFFLMIFDMSLTIQRSIMGCC